MKILRIIEVAVVIIAVLYMFAVSIQVNQMKKDLRKLKKKDRGVSYMSKIIEELVGKKCKIIYVDGLNTEMGQILAVDDEWLKIKVDSKKDKENVKVIRIDVIEQVAMLED